MFQHDGTYPESLQLGDEFLFQKKKKIHLSTVSLGLRKTGFGEGVLISCVSLAF